MQMKNVETEMRDTFDKAKNEIKERYNVLA
jgi:hypothetical protein